jgi:hypothetical protein
MLIPNRESIDVRLKKALHRLLTNDYYLLEKDVNERTISSRLAMYLQAVFRDWHVDCEYNKNHDVRKTLNILSKKMVPVGDTEARTVYPDIIVHQRATDLNLLVIEIKKTTSVEGTDFDKRKLSAFKDELGYHYAVTLELRTGIAECGIEELVYV